MLEILPINPMEILVMTRGGRIHTSGEQADTTEIQVTTQLMVEQVQILSVEEEVMIRFMALVDEIKGGGFISRLEQDGRLITDYNLEQTA